MLETVLLRKASQVAAARRGSESKPHEGTREGCVWHDVATEQTHWSDL